MSTPAAPDRSRPDACPGVITVHQAADGGLARVRVPGGAISAPAWFLLVDAAVELGDGLLELTSRGNVQIRGLAAGAEVELGARLAAVGLLPSPTHERARNILASPLSGRDGAGRLDVRPLVGPLDRGLCAVPALAELPGRFLFGLDDGRGDIAGLRPDVGVRGTAEGELALLLDGADSGLRTVPGSAIEVLLGAARAFLAERAAQRSGAWRLRELAAGAAGVLGRLTGHPGLAISGRAPAPGPGSHTTPPPGTALSGGRRWLAGPVPQVDGRVSVCAVAPLGRLSATQGRALAAAAGQLIVTPWRGVLVADIDGAEAAGLAATLSSHGLVVDQGSPWLGVTACTGSPGCARALADVRSAAAAALAVAAPPPAGSPPVHWAGCERRCGLPAGAVEVLATGAAYRVSAGGREWSAADPATAIEEARRQT